jgi:hypothetical protein
MGKTVIIKLKTELVSGTMRVYPDCDTSKMLVKLLRKNCLSLRELQVLSDVFEMEYNGLEHTGLDSLGAKYIV